MINENLTQDSEPGYNLIEYEEGNNIPIGFYCRNGLEPLTKVVYDHVNVLRSLNRSWVAIHKIQPPLVEGTDSNYWMERGWMLENVSIEHLVGVTLINHFNAIFKDR
jgi:hypothetical protein